jgi:hypothetical protein
MKSTKLTKLFAALTLAAVGITTSSTSLATVSCTSALKTWGTSYTLSCYNIWGYLEARGAGSTSSYPAPLYTKFATINHQQGSASQIQGQDSNGINIMDCLVRDWTADGIAQSVTSGCNSAATYRVTTWTE